jgi:hypothetical protein
MRMNSVRQLALPSLFALLAAGGCSKPASTAASSEYDGVPISSKALSAAPPTGAAAPAANAQAAGTHGGDWLGFDRNDYPGDGAMAAMRARFAFTGYWLTPPPGEEANSWLGKRAMLRAQGWGFLVLANGRFDAEIVKAQKGGRTAAGLGQADAAQAISAAAREGFPPKTILFLDQEEGGRLLDEQAAYLLAWTEGVAASGYRAGVYGSGQRVPDGPGASIDTVEDIRARVKKGQLHEIAIFSYNDACPPSNGCTLADAKPLSAGGEPDLSAWQFSQSPRRPENTKSCAATYHADGNCYAPGFPGTFLDMDIASSPDPSHGR